MRSRMTVLWSQIISVTSMLPGGLVLPYSMLPDIAGKFTQLLPATNALNGLAMGQAADFFALGLGDGFIDQRYSSFWAGSASVQLG